MLYNYEYPRVYNETYGWMIDNITYKDIAGNQLFLSDLVKNVLAGKPFELVCSDGLAIFRFSTELTPAEEATLQQTVADYQIVQSEDIK